MLTPVRFCNRCLKASKVCEGYARNLESGHTEPVRFVVYTPHNPDPVLSEHPDLDWPARRAMSYFQDRTALELAGAFRTDFWMSHILPLARQEPSVRHALIALSSMHEHYSGVDHSAPMNAVDFALDHYGRAMRQVVRYNQSNPGQTFEYALVTCALFSTFESLQGQYHEACNHAVSGIKILAEEQSKLLSNTLRTRIPQEALTRFFLALGRQVLELGDQNWPGTKPELHYTKTTIPMPALFTSHEHALLHMEILLGDFVEYADKADSLGNQGPISADVALSLITEFHAMKEQFDKWKSAFELFSSSESNEFSRETPESSRSSLSPASSPGEQISRPWRSPAFLILKVYYYLLTAFVARIERNDEAAFNEHVPDFWAALDAAEEFIQCTSTYVSPMDKTSSSSRSPLDPTSSTSYPQQASLPRMVRPTFSLALGIVPTLFLVASRASDVDVRDKALSLLRTCNRREGLWDSNLAAKVVDRILDLRELAAQLQDPDMDMITGEVQTTRIPVGPRRQAAEQTTPAPPGTAFGDSNGIPPGSNGITFKLMDIKFLPGRKCVIRYSFVRNTGEKHLPGTIIPSISDHERLVPGTRQYRGEFFEQIAWEK
ncbi:hypothetical protein PV04_08150 [Phialophora macrospora]|uniref:Zn(2)-C6 fungal-type domain-containing protein n=1 Tax=Phialophora macrospora TaxID=1851006 RepID=A0A0D2DV13_9EURO|nr:hypothetical protein PV04_08150 [Phialophora macrospora]